LERGADGARDRRTRLGAGDGNHKRGRHQGVSDTAIPTTAEEAAARTLAAQAGLEYREPGAVAVDPRALGVLPAIDCQRLRAVPLAASELGAVIGVSDPSQTRLDEIRSTTGTATQFVVLAEKTLDALLRSRIFVPAAKATGGRPDKTALPPPAEKTEAAYPSRESTAATRPTVDARTASEPVFDRHLVDAIVEALEPRLRAFAPPPAAEEPSRPVTEVPLDTSPPAPVAELLADVDSSIAAWTRLRSSLEALGAELESARRSLREAKERLSVAHAESDQHQRRIHTLEVELDERRAVLDEARLRLQEAAEALGGQTRRLENSGELV
jgi:hypothetical protein